MDRTDTALARIGRRSTDVGVELSSEISHPDKNSTVATGVDRTRFITRYYRWTVQRDETGITATQERYLPAWGRYLEAVVSMMIAVVTIGMWLFDVGYGGNQVASAGIVGFTLSLFVYFGFVLVANHGPDPFDDVDGTSQPVPVPMLTRILSLGSPVVPAFVVVEFWPVVFGGQPPPLFAQAGYVASTLLAVLCATAILWFHHDFPGIPDFSVQLPAGGAEYVLVTSMSTVPVAVVYLWAERLVSLSIGSMVGFLVVTEGAAFAAVVALSTNNTELVDAFRRGGLRYVPSRRVHLVTVVLGSGGGLVAGSLTVLTVPHVQVVVAAARAEPTPLLVAVAVVMVLAFLPGLYIWAGLLAQVAGMCVAIARLLWLGRRGRPASPSVRSAVSVPVRVVPGGGALATAVSLGPVTWVLLGEELVKSLDEDPLAAIAAHEYAHAAVYRDTLLALLAPFVATSLFVGQSAVLGLLNYQTREFRADRYAAKVTSPTAVVTALHDASTLSENEFAGTGPSDGTSLLPTPALARRRATWSPFSPTFDSVCVAEAHPSLSDRIAAVREQQNADRAAEDLSTA
ncbi:M48 family metalloprotease [Halobaculum rubrum]|uniref:M48 family metalloprotease n=1 Tax=Halobaculum rubrum TaxID=2872158 RepID=UPI001CA3AA69|nr:M48 family metalloprotease [Halobaculum rubrum]QZY01157.1 hypothetical protein K6T25_15320 [Halobaculum rubrum]